MIEKIIERMKKSIEARKQNWSSLHFEKTREGLRLARFKNMHAGEKCFIIGNGPSLTAEDLQTLYENKFVTFATNRIFNIFEKTDWRPTYYASEDIIVLKGIQNQIKDIPAKAKFIPINLKWYEDVNVEDASYFWMDYNSEMPDTFNLSLDVAHGIRCKGTVTISCIQLAIYMGFSEIYLLGVDHNYAKSIDENGNVVEDNTVIDYFCDKYDSDIKNELTHDIGSATRSFVDVERLSRKQKKFKVYNATRGGKLEVFERCSFDEVMCRCEGERLL